MNKYNLKCLFYANITDDKEIRILFSKIKNEFEKEKFCKHFLIGKTTSRRKGKKERKISKIRNRLIKINNILKFTKLLKQLPDLKNNLVGFNCKQSIYEFLEI